MHRHDPLKVCFKRIVCTCTEDNKSHIQKNIVFYKMELEFKVFTLNCWGLAVVSKNRRERIKAIAEVLATSSYDVVCLQEIWTDEDFNLIRNKAAGVLPFSHYFYSGVTGSGVCILSRHQIEETFFHQWSVNGYIHKLHHGDWFGGKGVGLCTMNVNGFRVNVYSAHLHAEYDRQCDEYQAHRVLQAYDTAQFILLTSGGADLVVLAGDLNTEPGDLAYRVILGIPGLVDSYEECSEVPQNMIATCEALKNSYTPSSLVKNKIPGKRIDYILYHNGPNIKTELKKYCLPLPEKVPEHNFSYSDHEAIEVILRSKKNEYCVRNIDLNYKRDTLEECVDVCNEALRRLVTNKIMFLCFALFLLVILLVLLILPPFLDYPIIYYIVEALVTAIMLFFVVMATLWNRIEKHGILAGKLAMEVTLKRLRDKEVL